MTSMYGAPLPEASEQLAAGTAEHSAAAVSERVQIFDDGFDAYVTVIVLDPEPMAQVMDCAKERAGVPHRDGLTMRWEGRRVPIDIVGEVPALPAGVTSHGPMMVVSRAALEEASGSEISATHLWLNGEGAAEAAAALRATGAEVTVRSEWTQALTGSPVAEQGARLMALTVAATVVVTVISVTMWCLAGSATRSRTHARMAVLGFPPRHRRRTALASAVVPVTVAAVLGVASGIAMTSSLVTPLGLEALAGGARVGLVVPWWLWVLPVLCAVVAAASSVRGASVGPYRLGGVLREG